MTDPLEELKKKMAQRDKELRYFKPYELAEELVDNILNDKANPLKFGISVLDDDIKTLRGKLGAFIGYGGTKKSLIALNIINRHAMENNGHSIYSTMEMSGTQLLERMIDYSFTPMSMDGGYTTLNASQFIYKRLSPEIRGKVLEEVQSGLKSFYGDNILISQNSRMTVDDYDALIRKAKNEFERIDMLVVDGLSMMGGNGTETETYTTNSGELKDLAKEHNIFIPLICHLSKGADLDTRDTRRYIRGSEKIIDNVDFVVMMSLIKNDLGEGFRDDIGYIRLFNKRGSGKTTNTIYEFDKHRLMLNETDIDPNTID